MFDEKDVPLVQEKRLPEIGIDELRTHFVTATVDDSGEPEKLKSLVDSLKTIALEFVKNQEVKPWMQESLQRQRYLDGVVSSMRHVQGGQDFILHELQKLKPDLCWYRGGTLTQWKDLIGSGSIQYFTPEQLNTYVIDGGKNGSLGRLTLALSYLHVAPRSKPAFYTLTLSDLLEGLSAKAIKLSTKHEYDLTINSDDNRQYVDFCRSNLKIQKVILNPS